MSSFQINFSVDPVDGNANNSPSPRTPKPTLEASSPEAQGRGGLTCSQANSSERSGPRNCCHPQTHGSAEKQLGQGFIKKLSRESWSSRSLQVDPKVKTIFKTILIIMCLFHFHSLPTILFSRGYQPHDSTADWSRSRLENPAAF